MIIFIGTGNCLSDRPHRVDTEGLDEEGKFTCLDCGGIVPLNDVIQVVEDKEQEESGFLNKMLRGEI